MKIHSIRRLALVAAGLASVATFVPRALAVWPPDSSPHKQAVGEVRKFIAAARQSDYAAVTADGDPTFSEITRQQFDDFAEKFGPRLAACTRISPLGNLKKGDGELALWRVAFGDGGDDLLLSLTMEGNRVTALAAN
jgi:cysteinyl-tRNA synthetase